MVYHLATAKSGNKKKKLIKPCSYKIWGKDRWNKLKFVRKNKVLEVHHFCHKMSSLFRHEEQLRINQFINTHKNQDPHFQDCEQCIVNGTTFSYKCLKFNIAITINFCQNCYSKCMKLQTWSEKRLNRSLFQYIYKNKFARTTSLRVKVHLCIRTAWFEGRS
jgi:hypothetical protein